MALDKTLAREIKQAVPTLDNRKAYFAFRDKLAAAAKEMSTPDVMVHFDEIAAKHGRVVTAIVVAATLVERSWRLDGWKLDWAREVMALWPHYPGAESWALIRDEELHPTRICGYARSFIECNTI